MIKMTNCMSALSMATVLMMAAGFTALATPGLAASPQMAGMSDSKSDASAKPLPSPAAQANVTLNGKSVTIHYNAPSMRGRKIMGGLVPYGEVWRTGANPATSLTTATALKIGTADVPAGSYTLYTLPTASAWMLIINKQTGQWGTKYDQAQDLVRVEMKKSTLPQPQEKMSINFEHTQGATTELHIRWETTDVSVPVSAH